MGKLAKTTNLITVSITTLAFGSALFLCLSSPLAISCSNTTMRDLESDSGRTHAVILERDCGATTSYVTVVQMNEQGENFKNVAIISGKPEESIASSSIPREGQVVLSINGCPRFLKYDHQHVTVQFVTSDCQIEGGYQ